MNEDFFSAFGATVKALRAHFDGMLREHGLRLGQYQLLRALWERDGLTPRELAEAAAVEMPTVTRTVGRMLRDGLVRREAHPHDARSVRIFLSPRGRAMEATATRLRSAAADAALAGVSEPERERLVGALKKILANLQTPE